MVSANVAPPNVLIGTLSVVSKMLLGISFMQYITNDVSRSASPYSTAPSLSFSSWTTFSRSWSTPSWTVSS
jgi:hypothetical protein